MEAIRRFAQKSQSRENKLMNTFLKTVTLCLITFLVFVPWTHAESNLDIEAGNITDTQGHVIVGKNNKIGLDEKAMKKELKGIEQRLTKKIAETKSSPTPPDPLFLQLLKKELAAVQAKFANVKQALKDREAVLAETKQALKSEKLKNVAPIEQLEVAQKKLNQVDTSEAETVLAEIIERAEPHLEASAEAAYRLAKLAYDRVDYRAAQKYYEKAVQLAPDNTLYLNDAGFVAHYLAQYDKAIEYFEKFLASNLKTFGPGHPRVTLVSKNLGLAWSYKGNYDKAIKYYDLSQ